jgi:TonB-dependent SusC/RagA subfamily outer membrane receptor
MNTRSAFGFLLVGLVTAACSGERLTGVAAEDAARRHQAQVLMPGTEPLFIVDGAEMSMVEVRRLAPERIAAIEVVKGASALSLYGERARAGVVVVTTKPRTIE